MYMVHVKYRHTHTHTHTHTTLLIARLSVTEVNTCLDELALSNAKRDNGGMKKSLQILLKNLGALEHAVT